MTKKKIISGVILIVVAVGLYFGKEYLNDDIIVVTPGGIVSTTDSTLTVTMDSTLTTIELDTDSVKTAIPVKEEDLPKETE